MKLKLLCEIAPSDLMPDSPDPYAGHDDETTEPEIEEPTPEEPGLEPEPAPELDIGAEAPPEELPQDISTEPEMTPDWVPEEPSDRRDLSFKHSEGFHLRMRRLDSSENKWLAQLYADDKILDKGFVKVPLGIDPTEYIIGITDKMLGTDVPVAPEPVSY